MNSPSRYSDLRTRIYSAIVLIAIGLTAILTGGYVFLALLVCVHGAMYWEGMGLFGKTGPMAIGAAVIASAALVLWVLAMPVVVGLIAVLLLGYLLWQVGAKAWRLVLLLVAISISCWYLFNLREGQGIWALIWVIACVAASDVGGYFFGRWLGGPKLWPAVSPKKTWSGTIGGWALAMGVTLPFIAAGLCDAGYLPIAVIIALAAQAGDLAESAIKRRQGVKDASDLIPGHGGFLDRFDGLIGASIVLWAVTGLGLFSFWSAG